MLQNPMLQYVRESSSIVLYVIGSDAYRRKMLAFVLVAALMHTQ
jgi:hypothetical protein